MENKTIETRHELHWHLADVYIQLFKALKGYKQDEAFHKMIDGLQNYIIDKLALESDDEIIDTYVVVLQAGKA